MQQLTQVRGETIEMTIDGVVATIWLARPDAYNTINLRLTEELKAIAFDLEASRDVRVVVLRGRGRQFSAGGDIEMFQDNIESMRRFITDVIANFHEILVTFRRMSKTTVAVVHGAVAGGGLSLALACDIVVAEERTKFAIAYRRLGASADGGMTHLLTRLLGQRKAIELLLLSDAFSAAEALRLGLINRVVAEPDIEAEIANLTLALAENAPASVGALKRLTYEAPTASFEEQLSRELAAFAECAATADFREGIKAFRERRNPVFQGH